MTKFLMIAKGAPRRKIALALSEQNPDAHSQSIVRQKSSYILSLLKFAGNRGGKMVLVAVVCIIGFSMLSSLGEDLNTNSAAQVAKLIAVIRGNDIVLAIAALEAIKVYGPDASNAVPALVDVLHGKKFEPLKEGDGFDRIGVWLSKVGAIDALAEIGPKAAAAVPSLIELPEQFSPRVFRCLGAIGPDARDAVPKLMAALTNHEPYTLCQAVDSLTRIDPHPASNVVAVLRGLQQGPPVGENSWVLQNVWPCSNYFRLAATTSLWRLGLEHEPPVMEIVIELENGGPVSPMDWLNLLGEIGPLAKPALPSLEKRLKTAYPLNERRYIAVAIRRIDPEEAAKLALPGSLGLPSRKQH